MKIVYLDRATLSATTQLRAPLGLHDWSCFDSTNPESVIARCMGAEVVATNKVPITQAILEACPSIRHIAVSATGYNCVDIDACSKHVVSVSNVPNYASTTVPEHVITLTLALRRELIAYRAQVIAGKWQTSKTFCVFDKPIRDVRNATFGVIGFGGLGEATGLLANALGMQVIYSSPSDKQSDFAKRVKFSELLARSDVISLHCSLTPSTHNLIGQHELAKMQPHCILINTARGGVANEKEVARAVQDNIIGGIGFDVLEQEPPTQGSPLLDISHLDNVIITPHTAWASEHALQRVADILIDNIDAFIEQRPQNIVS
ncbi:MAG: glycerate dehydrogenase [Cryomorphaceae bacterium]|jgi:glycerate dehydrogenase